MRGRSHQASRCNVGDPANVGAVAFNRAGNLSIGKFSVVVVLKKLGNVPDDSCKL